MVTRIMTKNKYVLKAYNWLYGSEFVHHTHTSYDGKVTRVLSLNSFYVDTPSSRKRVSPVWDYHRLKALMGRGAKWLLRLR